jgi:hypothetical protein
MSFFQRIYRSDFSIKLRHWEYWPFGILQAPFFLYWLWLSLKTRSLFFFSASNPTIHTGGMLGESKKAALDLVPHTHKPITILITLPTSLAEASQAMMNAGLRYPVIAKPDIGERGWKVQRINNETDLQQYIEQAPIDFLIQAFVDLPLEFGVFYVRKPSEENGRVISITSKEMLTVTGNGKDSLAMLVYKNDRAKLQQQRLSEIFNTQWQTVIPKNEVVLLNSIGNHCLGTKFMNGNALITPELNASFNMLSKQINGFYFGRFDLRCASVEALQRAEVIIMELNGCGAEPAHIYQPGYSIWKALAVLYRHWRTMYEISAENHARGVPYLTFKEGRRTYQHTKKIFSARVAG